MPRSARSAAREHGERLAEKEAQAPVVEEGCITVVGNGHPGSCGCFWSSFSPQAENNLTKRATDFLPAWRLCQSTTTPGITAYLIHSASVNSRKPRCPLDYSQEIHQKQRRFPAGRYPLSDRPRPSLACRCSTAFPGIPSRGCQGLPPAGA